MASGEGRVIVCNTAEKWNEEIQKGIESKKLIVMAFTAIWYASCRALDPTFATCASDFRHFKFLRVDVDKVPMVAKEWHVNRLPTFVILKEGNVAETFFNVEPTTLRERIAKYVA